MNTNCCEIISFSATCFNKITKLDQKKICQSRYGYLIVFVKLWKDKRGNLEEKNFQYNSFVMDIISILSMINIYHVIEKYIKFMR